MQPTKEIPVGLKYCPVPQIKMIREIFEETITYLILAWKTQIIDQIDI